MCCAASSLVSSLSAGFPAQASPPLRPSWRRCSGPRRGALHLRTDVVRKALFGVGETDRLGAETYTPEDLGEGLRGGARQGEVGAVAGHSVIVDAVFARVDEREDVERLAQACGVRFDGLWSKPPPRS